MTFEIGQRYVKDNLPDTVIEVTAVHGNMIFGRTFQGHELIDIESDKLWLAGFHQWRVADQFDPGFRPSRRVIEEPSGQMAVI